MSAVKDGALSVITGGGATANTLIVSGAISDTHAAASGAATGRLLINAATGASGVVQLSNANTYTEGTFILAGALQISNSGALGSPTPGTNFTKIDDAATLQLSGNLTLATGAPIQIGAGMGGFGNLVDLGNSSVNDTIVLDDGNPPGASASEIDVDTAGDTLTLNGVITGASVGGATGGGAGAGIFKGGPGILVLPATTANTFDGNVSVFSGVLSIANPLSLGKPTVTRTVLVENGATLQIQGNFAVGAGSAWEDFAVSGGAIEEVSGASIITGALRLNTNDISAGTTATIQTDGASSLTIGGVVSDATNPGKNPLIKTGAGTLILSGTNTYSDTTTVNAGSLIINGTQSASTVEVASGGLLGGDGTTGPVTDASGGVISPGQASAAVLNAMGNVGFNAGSKYAVDLLGTTPGAGGYDQLNVVGAVDLGGATLVLHFGSSFPTGTPFTIIQATGAINGQFAGLPLGQTVVVKDDNGGRHAVQLNVVAGGPGNTLVLTLEPTPPANADLTITKTDDHGGNSNGTAGSVAPGAALTYTITVSNSGPDEASGTTVSDALPAGFTETGYTSVVAGGATDLHPTGAGNISDTVDLPSGGSITYTVTGTISAGAPALISNSATLTAGAGVTDSNPITSATDSDTVTAAPAPALTSINPTSVPAGSPNTTITVTGTNFVSTSVVDYKGAPLATTFVSSTQETAIVPSADLTTAGPATITVVTPGPGGGTSNALTFTVSPITMAAGDVVLNGAVGDQLFLQQAPDSVIGDVTYTITHADGTHQTTTLTGVTSLTFRGAGANVVTIQFPANGQALVNGPISINGVPAVQGTTTLNLDANGLIVRVVPGGVSVGDPQTVTYSNVQSIQINGAVAVNAFAGPDTADRATAFTGLTAQERFVQALYLDELGRAGAKSELDGWVSVYNSAGATAVVGSIEHSFEGRDHLVHSWYLNYLNRPATGGEELGWVNLLLSGQTEEKVLSQILGSSEFFNDAQTLIGGANAQQNYAQALYQVLLNRRGEAGGVNGIVNTLPLLGTQGVALAFLQSQEFRTDDFEAYFNALLHRPDDPTGLNGWIFSNLDIGSVRLGFEAGSEFFTNG